MTIAESLRQESALKIAASLRFTFSDLIAGYVTSALQDGRFAMQTSDGRRFDVKLTDATYAEMVRNLGEPWQDPNMPLETLLQPGQFVFAYGIFYPENDQLNFEVKHLLFVGRRPDEWRFEEPDWWITMA